MIVVTKTRDKGSANIGYYRLEGLDEMHRIVYHPLGVYRKERRVDAANQNKSKDLGKKGSEGINEDGNLEDKNARRLALLIGERSDWIGRLTRKTKSLTTAGSAYGSSKESKIPTTSLGVRDRTNPVSFGVIKSNKSPNNQREPLLRTISG